jgi:hypothetical protein
MHSSSIPRDSIPRRGGELAAAAGRPFELDQDLSAGKRAWELDATLGRAAPASETPLWGSAREMRPEVGLVLAELYQI